MSVLQGPGVLGNHWSLDVLGHILRKGTCGISIRYTILSNRNAESGTAQSKGIPHELQVSGTSLPGREENIFHFPWESMPQFFPLGGKNFSFSLTTAPPGSTSKSGYTA
jgi:hypothetical protein